MTIWKYQLRVSDRQQVIMPVGATILSAHLQYGSVCLWAMVDEDLKESQERNIEIIGTGNPIPRGDRRFIGTVIASPFVWHVFERIEI